MKPRCQMQSTEALMAGARKLTVQACVACLGEAYIKSEAEFHSVPDQSQDMEILKSHIPLLLPAELTEKEFQLEEPVDIPGGAPAMDYLVAYQLVPEITESRVLSAKAVFKGRCRLHLVYMTAEQHLSVCDPEIPFSQFADLSGHMRTTNSFNVSRSSLLHRLNRTAVGIFLRCGLCTQCTVLEKRTVEIVSDLYSLHRSVKPVYSPVPLRT